MANKNFEVKHGLSVGGTERITSAGAGSFTNLTLSGDLALTGDLNITGDVNSVSVTDLDVTDKTITLGKGQVESASGGSGIVVDGSSASLLWNESNSQFDFNKGITIDGTSKFTIGSGEEVDFYRSSNANFKIALGSANAELSSVAQINIKPQGTSVSKYQLLANTFYINGPSVGIGTSSPSEYLEFSRTSGKIGWGMNGNYGVRIGYFDDTGGVHGFHVDTKSAGTVTSESRFVVRADSGNVGIGTKSPGAKLHVANAATEEYIFETTDNNTRSQVEVKSKDSSGNALQARLSTMGDGPYGMLYTYTNHNLTFATNNAAPQMTLDTSGNVGIGETTPLGKLHVKEGDSGQGSINSNFDQLVLEDDAHSGMTILSGTSSDGGIYFGDSGGNNMGQFKYKHGTNSFTFATNNGSESLIIDSSGHVGIGTTSLGTEATLHIGKPAGASSAEGGQLVLQSSTNGSLAPHLDAYTNASVDYLRVLKGNDTASSAVHSVFDLTNTRLGIGVSAPTARLELDNPSSFTNMIEYGNVTWNQNTGHGLVAVNRGSDGYAQLQITSGVDNADVITIRSSVTGAAGLKHNLLSNGNVTHSGSLEAGGVITANHIIRSDAGHSTSRVEAVYDDNSAQYDSNILMWVSEPGYTYDSGGIGVNVHDSGHYYGRKYNNDYAVFMRFIKSDGSIQFGQNQGTSGTAGASQTETLKITANSILRLATNGGIGFGTTNAADTLDDYEEGTFTPTLMNAGSPSFAYRSGWYTKIGDIVHFNIFIDVTSGISGTSQVQIGGLPFNISSKGNLNYVMFNLFIERGVNGGSATQGYAALGQAGSTSMEIWEQFSTTGYNYNGLNYGEVNSSSFRVRISGTYHA